MICPKRVHALVWLIILSLAFKRNTMTWMKFIIIFDRYAVPRSLKQKTRATRATFYSDQEEADTKLIGLLHAADATACDATSIDICSLDKDVLVLSIRRYTRHLCRNTNFITETGKKCWVIQLAKSMMHLEQKRQQHCRLCIPSVAATTPTVLLERGNAASGRHFSLQTVPLSQHQPLLAQTTKLHDSTFAAIEEFVCKVYDPQTHISYNV